MRNALVVRDASRLEATLELRSITGNVDLTAASSPPTLITMQERTLAPPMDLSVRWPPVCLGISPDLPVHLHLPGGC